METETSKTETAQKLIVTSSPHVRGSSTTQKIMRDVLIALAPCVIAGTIFFGLRALLVVAVTTAAAVLTEFISRIIMKRRQTVQDLSSAVTGVILGLILPSQTNLLVAAFGSVVAIAVIKQMFGGIGQNFMNPAAGARVVLLLSFASMMAKYTAPSLIWENAEAVTSATPLVTKAASYLDLFTGNTAGCIGETSVIAILIGFAYLLARKVINPIIPLAYIGSSALMALALGSDPLYQLMSGGLMFGAVFMATDYATSPINPWGKLVYGAGCGVITMMIRTFASLPEGVSFAIILMNIITPHLDNLFVPRPFGCERSKTK